MDRVAASEQEVFDDVDAKRSFPWANDIPIGGNADGPLDIQRFEHSKFRCARCLTARGSQPASQTLAGGEALLGSILGTADRQWQIVLTCNWLGFGSVWVDYNARRDCFTCPIVPLEKYPSIETIRLIVKALQRRENAAEH